MTRLIIAVYVLGFLLSIRPLAAAVLDEEIGNFVRLNPSSQRTLRDLYRVGADGIVEPTRKARIDATWRGAVTALAWFLVMPIHLLARTVTAPTEREQAERRELQRLREFAKREGLPMEGDE